MFGKGMTFNTEVTNGTCPSCSENTIFVSIYSHVYRCMTCGSDTTQKINGVISFMPITPPGAKPPVLKLLHEDGPEKA
jgi:transposase-like protein